MVTFYLLGIVCVYPGNELYVDCEICTELQNSLVTDGYLLSNRYTDKAYLYAM